MAREEQQGGGLRALTPRGPCEQPSTGTSSRRWHLRRGPGQKLKPKFTQTPKWGSWHWHCLALESSIQLLTVDRSARGSMKTAAKCVSACESQDYQMHRPVERTLRRRYYPVMSPLPDECLLTHSIHPLPAGRSGWAEASRPRTDRAAGCARGALGSSPRL